MIMMLEAIYENIKWNFTFPSFKFDFFDAIWLLFTISSCSFKCNLLPVDDLSIELLSCELHSLDSRLAIKIHQKNISIIFFSFYKFYICVCKCTNEENWNFWAKKIKKLKIWTFLHFSLVSNVCLQVLYALWNV
jgi:hypothetical protein